MSLPSLAAPAHATALSVATDGMLEGSAAAEASKPSKNKSSKNKSSKNKSSKNKSDADAAAGSDAAAKGAGEASGADAGSKGEAKPPEASKAEPKAEPAGTLQLDLPLKIKGKVSKSTQGRLIGRLEAALAGAKVEGGPFHVRLAVGLSKSDYTLTLILSGADGKELAQVSEPCKGCSVSEAGDKVAALVPQAVAKLDELARAPGEVTVASTTPGAVIIVDGKERGPAPQVLELSPGEHTVKVAKNGFAEQSQTITVEPQGKQQLQLDLVPDPVAPLEPSPAAETGAPPPTEEGDGGKGKHKRGKEAPTGPKAGKPWTIAGGVLLGLGLASVATGVALILVDEEPIPSKCKGDQL
ncbi:MAG: PEGA domain-containing protein, partial [Myxococcales bacterium]|nr:PEGA domain-containing protein [Myxococcales bacterium]